MRLDADLGPAQIYLCAVSDMDNRCYLVVDTATGDRVLIDAADDVEALAQLIDAPTVPGTVSSVVTTHTHWDHIRALPQLIDRTGARALVGRGDEADLPVPADRVLDDGDTVPVGSMGLNVLHLGGHTPGSIALVLSVAGAPTHIFTGDGLFPGGVGKTANRADFDELFGAVESKIFGAYPDETVIHPGHGEGTTLGVERPHLLQWRERGW